jgi:phospholipase/lecithinase/hemolysin
LAAFYAKVFGWSIRDHGKSPAFTDRSGHVIGHFVSDQAPTADHGIRPYIYVESVVDTIEQALRTAPASQPSPTPRATSPSPPSATRPATRSGSGSSRG